MKFAQLYRKLYCEPLMLNAEAFSAFDLAFQARLNAGPLAPGPVRPMDSGKDAPLSESIDFYRRWRATQEQVRVEDVLRKYGPLAVVQVHGVIDRNVSQMELDCYGACDLQDINAALADAEADSTITTVLIDFDTPGGSVTGMAETAGIIARLAESRTVVAAVFGQCCSAGYYLASQCQEIVIGESAWAGSVGVYCARLDATKALEKQGLEVTLVSSSEQKADGSPYKPMTPEEKARLQACVDDLYADFKGKVTAGRPDVSDDVMQAQVYRGQAAIDAGLADTLGTTLDDIAAELVQG